MMPIDNDVSLDLTKQIALFGEQRPTATSQLSVKEKGEQNDNGDRDAQ
jgi:hypothetical protein